MTTFTSNPRKLEEVLGMQDSATSRRHFLKTSGFIVVSFSAAAVTGTGPFAAAAGSEGAGVQRAGPYPDPDFRQLDSWIVFHENNTATF